MRNSYLFRAIDFWFMDKFWSAEKFFRRYPKEFAYTRIVDFINKECRTYKGQNFYKGYPFVYYVKNNLVRCGLVIKGHIYYSSFNLVEEMATVETIRVSMESVIAQHGNSYLYALLYSTLLECGAKREDLVDEDKKAITVKTSKGSVTFDILENVSRSDADTLRQEIERLY